MAKDKKQKKEGFLSRLRGKPKPDFELEELIQRVQEDPEDMRTRLKLADAYLKFEEPGKALDQYLTVAETYADKGFYPKAVAVYKQILTIEPKLIEVHIKLADLYHKLGLMGEVVAQFQKAASIYESDGKIKLALDTMKRLIELSPENVKGRIKLGQRYLNEGFREDAYLQFMEVAKLFRKLEKNTELAKLYEGLMDRGFENFEIIQELSELYAEVGQQDKILKMIESLKGEMANSVTVLELYADVAEHAEKPQKSISALHKVIEAYESTGRNDVTQETCERILGLDPKDSIALEKMEQMRLAEQEDDQDVAIEEIPEAEEIPEQIEELPEMEEAPEVSLEADTEEIPEVEDIPILEEEPEAEEIPIAEEEPDVEEIPVAEEEIEPEELPSLENETDVEPLPEIERSSEPEIEELPEIEQLPDLEESHEFSEETAGPEESDSPDMLRESEDEIPLRIESEETGEEAPEIEPTLREEELPEELPTIEELEESEEEEVASEDIPVQPLDEESGDELPTIETLQPTLDEPEAPEVPESASEEDFELPTEGEIDMFDQDIPIEEAEPEEQEVEPEMEISDVPELEAEVAPEPEPEPEPELLDYSEMSDQDTYDHIDRVCDIYLDSGLNDKALEYLKLSVEKNPDSIPVHEKLLVIYDNTGEEELATEALDTLIDLCEKQQRTGKLLEFVDRKYESDPTNLRVAEQLASLLATEEKDRAVVLLFGMTGQVKQADDLDKAAQYLSSILEIEPDNAKAFDDLLDLRMSFNDIPGSIELLQSGADNALAKDDLQLARDRHENVLSLKPAEAVSNEALLDIYEKQDDTDTMLDHLSKLTDAAISKKENEAAFGYLDRILSIDPENLDAVLIRKDLYLAEENEEQAIRSLFDATTIQTGLGLGDDSEASLKEILKLSSKNTKARHMLKDIYIGKSETEKALAQLFTLAEQAQSDSQPDEYESLLREVIQLDGENEEGLRKMADLYLKTDQPEQAVETLFTLAEILNGKENAAGAESALREVVSIQPDSIDARLKLRDHYLSAEDTDRAIIEIRKAAELYLKGDEQEQALESYERIIYLNDQDIEARTAIKNIYQSLGNSEAVVEQLMTISVLYQQAESLEEAASTLREVLKIKPDNRGAFESLKDIYIEAEQIDRAIELCTEKAEAFYSDEKVDDALALYGDIVDFAPDHIQTALRYKDLLLASDEVGSAIEQLIRLSELYAEADQLAKAEDSLKQLLLYNTNHIEALNLLKRLYIDSDQTGKALDLLYGFVDIDLDANDFDSARNHISELLELSPNDPQSLEYLARVEQLTGNTAEAINTFMKLAEIHSDQPKERSKYLDKAIGLDPDNIQTRRFLADLFIEQGDKDSAYKHLIEIATFEMNAENFENVEATLLECTGMEPEKDIAWSMLADLYERTDQTPKALDALFNTADIRQKRENTFGAEEMLNRVLLLDAKNAKALSLLSELHINAGDTVQAISELFQLVQGSVDNNDIDSALGLCGKILKLDEGNEQAMLKTAELHELNEDEENLLLTYFTLDDFYRSSGDFASSNQILQKAVSMANDNSDIHDRLLSCLKGQDDTQGMIDENFRFAELTEDPDAQLQLMADVLSIEQNHEPALLKMKDIFVDQGKQGKAIEQLFLLSENAFVDENSDKMVDYLEEIMLMEPTNEKAHQSLVDHFMELEDHDRALGLMIDFAKSADEAGQTELSAKTYEEILRINPIYLPALESLKDKARAADQTEKAVEYLFSMTDIAMDEDNVDKAGELLREVTDISPDNFDAWERLKTLYEDAGDNEKAISVIFEILEKSADTIPLDQKEQYLEEVLRHDPDNEKALLESRKLYKEAGENEKAIETIFKLATMQTEAGKTSRLEEFYREVLDIDPQSILARQNLCSLYKEQGLKDKAASEYFALADLAAESDDSAKAIDYYHEILEMDVARERAYKKLKKAYKEQADDAKLIETCFALADLAKEKENLSNAESLLREIIELAPDNEKARLSLKDLFIEQDNLKAASDELFALADIASDSNDSKAELAYIEQVVAFDEKNPIALHRLKDHYQKAQDTAKTLELLESLYAIAEGNEDVAGMEELIRESIDMGPVDPAPYNKLIDLYKDQGESEKAVIELFNLIEMLQETERESQVMEPLQQIIKIDRNNEEAHIRLRDIFIESGDKKASIGELFALVRIANNAGRNKLAEKHLRHIFKLDPKNRKAKEKLAELFMASVEQDEKIEELFGQAKKAIEEGQPALAKSAYMEVLTLDPDNIDAKNRLNQLYLKDTKTAAPPAEPELDVFDESIVTEKHVPEPEQIEPQTPARSEDVDLFSDEFTTAAEARLDSTFDDPVTEPEEAFVEEDIFNDVDESVEVEKVDVFAAPTEPEVETEAPVFDTHVAPDEAPEEEIDAFGEDDQYATAEQQPEEKLEPPVAEAVEEEDEEVDLFAEPEEEPEPEPKEKEVDLFADAQGMPGQPREFPEPTEEVAEPEPEAPAPPEDDKADLFGEVFGAEESSEETAKVGTAIDGDAFDDLLSDLSSDEPMQDAGGDDLFGDIVQDFKAGLSEEKAETAETHFNLGIAYREIDSIKEAISEFERALALGDPKMEFTINQNLGECYADIGEFAQAAQYIQSALDLSESADEREVLDLMVDLGLIFIELDKYAKAIELLNEVDNLNSNYRGCRNIIKDARKKAKDGKKKKKGGDDDDNVGYV